MEDMLQKENTSLDKNNKTEMTSLAESYEKIENIVLKRYLQTLSNRKLVAPPKELDEKDFKENIMLFKITEMVYEKDEYSLYKLATVFNSVSHINCSVFIILDSNKRRTDFYMGVRVNEDKVTKSVCVALKDSLRGQFPGVKTKILDLDEQNCIIEKIKNPENSSKISAVSCVANIKDEDFNDNKNFIQGLEKLALSAQGKEYTAIIIADSVDNEEINIVRNEYESIYSALYPLSNQQISHGTNYSQTNTTNVTLGETYSVSKKNTLSKALGVISGVAGSVAGIALTATGAGSSVGVPLIAVSMGTGAAAAFNDETTTEAQSKSISNSRAEQSGTTQNINLNVQNKKILNVLSKLDKHMERLDEFESIGSWNCCAYFLSRLPSVSEQVAANYRAIMCGENTAIEASAINSWQTKGAETPEYKRHRDLITYISHFKHPIFEVDTIDKISIELDASTLVSSNELAIHMGLPRHSVCGFPVIEHADFAKEIYTYDNIQEQDNKENIEIGNIFNMGDITRTPVFLNKESFCAHTFITGSTGSGKSNTVYQLLNQLNTNFMVIEPAKGEYKHVFGNRSDVEVYGTNKKLSKLLRINPFSFPDEIHIYEHIDRLVEIFNACWPMYAAMPAVLKDSIISAYEKCGWDLVESECFATPTLYPSFADVCTCINDAINNSAYSADTKGDYIGSLVTRLNSLTNGINSLVFSPDELSNEVLFDRKVIVDLSRVGSLETKSLIMGILIMKLNEHRISTVKGTNQRLQHITVLEEAHNILKRTSTEQSQDSSNLAGKSVEMISNSIAEMRTYGEGFIIADQSPSSVDISAIKNTNTKIIMRLPEESDRRVAGKSAGLKDEQLDELSKLPTGVAIVYQNNFVEPVICKINRFENDEEQYHYNIVEEKENNSKDVASDLLKFLLSRGNFADINLDRIKKNLSKAILLSSTKLSIQSLIEEFEKNGVLSIWDTDNFAELSAIITQIVFGSNKVSQTIDNCDTLDKINDKLYSELKKKIIVENVSNSNIIDAFQCFMKSYAVENNDVSIYAYWRNDVKEKGGNIL